VNIIMSLDKAKTIPPANLRVQTCWPFGLLPDEDPDIVFAVPGMHVACPECAKVTQFSSVIKHMCSETRTNFCREFVEKFAYFVELKDYQPVSKTTKKPSGPVRFHAKLKDIWYKTDVVTDSEAFYKGHEEDIIQANLEACLCCKEKGIQSTHKGKKEKFTKPVVKQANPNTVDQCFLDNFASMERSEAMNAAAFAMVLQPYTSV
jgi:hypothetical protein